jgi:zinc D-Ala-D-Ala carboxypeptidase
MKISDHITLAEAIKSQTAVRKGIDNAPNDEQIRAMKAVAKNCFEPLREWHGKPIGISSFFRSKALNKAVNGSPKSQHMLGQAIDIDADIFKNGLTNGQIYNWLKKNVDFDQLIWEYGDDKNPAWVHVSYVGPGKNRKQELRIS